MPTFSQHQYADLLNLSKSSLNKHQIIQKYKENERQKSILKNKLNILKQECQKYHRKARNIQSSFNKVNKIKEKYKKDKEQIEHQLQRNQEKQSEKIEKVKQFKEYNKGRLPIIKCWLKREKSNDYLIAKKKSQIIQQKIRVFRNTIVSQRKRTVHQIKEEQKMLPFNRTLYMQIKHKNARIYQQEEALKIEKKFKKSRQEFQHMKNLEDALLEKLNKSRTKLNQSISKLGKSIRA